MTIDEALWVGACIGFLGGTLTTWLNMRLHARQRSLPGRLADWWHDLDA